MQNIKTIAGTFTIGTYEIPKQYVCAKTPTITQKNDICEIVTYDQQITVNGHNYAPVLHQNCMQPEQITLYPLVIRQEHATLTVSDRYHTGHWKSGDDTQISDWRPKLMHRGCGAMYQLRKVLALFIFYSSQSVTADLFSLGL